MELITQAMTTALSRLDEESVKELYTDLKADLQTKYGTDVAEAISDLEKSPDSNDCVEELDDQIIIVGANKDKALIALAKTLIDALTPGDTPSGMGQAGTALADDYMMASFDDDDELIIGNKDSD